MALHLFWQEKELPTLSQRELVSTLLATTLLLILFRILISVYYQAFHPLSQFSGPPGAATSRHWVYRVTDRGFPEEDFERLHKQYQTHVLRIGPNELHISDVEQYRIIYSQSKPFPKYGTFYEAFNTPHTVFTETDRDMHKERRRLLNPLFSRVGVFKLEPVIHEKVGIMLKKIDHLKESQSINVYDAFRCLTTEVIMEFAFAKSANMLEENETTFESWFLTAFDAVSGSLWKLQEWPLVRKALYFVPTSLVSLVDPQIAYVARMLKFAESCLQHYTIHGNTTPHPVVFDNLSSVSYDFKVTEALDVLIAGADTTASTLTTGVLHILSSPDIHAKLRQALNNTEEPTGMQLLELEKIDYLIACVKESLRIGMAVPGRLPRVVPHDLLQPFVVDNKVIPPGTVVSMSAYTMHTNEDVWGPDAQKFNPHRWLRPESKGLDQYLCTFSKGSRMCIGQNVAYAEIIIVMAYLFRNFELGLPQDFVPPQRRDLFTMGYSQPGLPIHFSRLEKNGVRSRPLSLDSDITK